MSKVSRRRTNQLCNLMRMLELRAINLDACPCVSKQRLSHGFDHSRFSRSRGSQEEQVSYWTSGRIQTRQKHLIDFDDLIDSCVLPHNAAAKGGIKLSSIVAATVWIEHCCKVRSHKIMRRAPGHFPFREPFSLALAYLFPDPVGLSPCLAPLSRSRPTLPPLPVSGCY